MIPAGALVRGAAIFIAITALGPVQAQAKPLAEETCKVLKAEYAALRERGVRQTMQNGPRWAKANLSEPELRRIKRYLMLQDHIKFRCFPPKKKKKRKGEEARTAAQGKKGVPLPTRKPLPIMARRGLAEPQKPAELDLEAIRDSLHGFQDADALNPGQIKPRPRGDRSGRGPAGPPGAARRVTSQPAVFSPALGAITPRAATTSSAVTYTVRELTEADLAASAGVRRGAEPDEKPHRKASRRQRLKKKIDWDPFGFDSSAN